ncbi:hypothetical protein D3C75_1129670 [compost metagenome]
MFDLTGDDMAGLVPLGNAFERKIVGLGSPRSPDNLPSLGTDQGGDLDARLLDSQACLLAITVRPGCRIAKVARGTKALDHHLDDSLVDRCRGGVVEIQRETVHCCRLSGCPCLVKKTLPLYAQARIDSIVPQNQLER